MTGAAMLAMKFPSDTNLALFLGDVEDQLQDFEFYYSAMRTTAYFPSEDAERSEQLFDLMQEYGGSVVSH